MTPRVLVLGAGFGGLELATTLSEAFADGVDVTIIDQADAFVFGYSKLDVMFGRTTLDRVRLPYSAFVKPGVRILHETITAIDPAARIVETDAGTHQADHLVIALGADYDMDATPGLAEGGDEFYTVDGAERLAATVAGFESGRIVVGICGAPYKCPPAPSECALMMHDELVRRGVRGQCEITFAIPFGTPIPPSPDTSAALMEAFAERGIAFVPQHRVGSIDPGRRVAVLEGGGELEFDLFLGVPRHRAPDVVLQSGLAVDGFVPVDSRTLATGVPHVYAIGDVATVGVPKAGAFAEGQARALASALIAELREDGAGEPYDGRASCFIEFGAGRIARVDVEVDFLSGPTMTGRFRAPSAELRAEKVAFGATRRARWFGLD
jgi:sulfide:quinone oxidoreductase